MDDKKRMDLWQQHLVNFSERETLSEIFKFSKVDNALKDFENVLNILNQIGSLISSEIISVGEEKKTDEEILADLKRIKDVSGIEKLTETLIYEKNKQVTILELFREIHDLLLAEIHLISLIKRKPSKDLLVNLFMLISHQEFRLYKVFRKGYYEEENKSIHAGIVKLANAVILEQELEDFRESEEEIFAKKIIEKMAPSEGESMHHYRKLAEMIFDELVKMAKESLTEEEDIVDVVSKFEEFLSDDAAIYKLVKKLRPKYEDSKIKLVALAFRSSYGVGHFEDWEEEFVD